MTEGTEIATKIPMKLIPLCQSTDSEDSEVEEFTDNNVNAPKPLYPDASIYTKDSILSIMHPCFHGIIVIIIIVNFIIVTDCVFMGELY